MNALQITALGFRTSAQNAGTLTPHEVKHLLLVAAEQCDALVGLIVEHAYLKAAIAELTAYPEADS